MTLSYFQRFGVKTDLTLLALISGVVLFVGLGQNYNWASREIRHAEIIREMAESGDFLIPRCLGKIYVDKPAVFHVVGAWFMKASGHPSLWTARLPLALAGFIGVFATYLLGGLALSRPVALLGAAGMLGTPNYVSMARQARPDMFLAVAVLVCCLFLGYCMHSADARRRILFAVLAGIAAGVGVITKGPYGVIFPAIFVLLAPIEKKEWRRPRWEWAAFGIGFIAIAATWLVPAYVSDGGEYLRRIFTQRDLTTGASGHARPFYWYIGALAVTGMPLSLYLPFAAKKWKQHGYSGMLAITAAILLILSFVPGKRNHYLLPLFPFLALGVADAIVLYSSASAWLRRTAMVLIPLSWVLAVLFYTVYLPIRFPGGDPEFRFARRVAAAISAQDQVVCLEGMDEELAWVQMRHNNIRSVSDVAAAASRLAASGAGSLLVMPEELLPEAKQLIPEGSLLKVFAAPKFRRKTWALYRYFSITGQERPAQNSSKGENLKSATSGQTGGSK